MARSSRKQLIIGIGGHVVSLDPATGKEHWRTKLKGGAFSFVTLAMSEDRIFAGSSGELFCLDARTGAVLWTNELKRLGTNTIAFGLGQDVIAGAAAYTQQVAVAGA